MTNRKIAQSICIGLVDGLTIPLALAAGLSGIMNSVSTVIFACLATAFAGSLTMTLGGYFEAKKYDQQSRPVSSAILIGVGYLLGGVIVTIPYFFTEVPLNALKYSAALTLVLLIISGYWESVLNGGKGVTGAIRVSATGAVAAIAAFITAKLFMAD